MPETDRKFRKEERLCSKKAIGDLFKSGIILKQYPFKVVYAYSEYNESPVKIVVSVPKKNFKRAVKRNYLKRRIKEAYRLNKFILYNSVGNGYTVNIMLIYIATHIIDYREIEKKLTHTLHTLAENITKNPDIYPTDVD